jgi:hypothetical protein
MPGMVATHAVEDVQRWLAGKEARAAAIGAASGSNVTDYAAQDGSNNVAVTADVGDLEAMAAMVASPSPDEVALMQSHGVVPPITVYLET